MSKIQVIIVDDHQLFIDGLQLILAEEEAIKVVGSANQGKDAINILNRIRVDVVLLDVEMPIMDGLEACKRIRIQFPEVKVIALTTYNKSGIIRQMLKNGASGYLLKDAGKEEFILAIKKVFDGETYLSQSASQALLNSILKRRGRILNTRLTRREKEVLDLISKELNTQDIADKLHLSVNTIEYHRRNLFNKLGAKNVAGLVRKAMEKGLLD